MESEAYSLVSHLHFAENEIEREIISCLVQNYIQQRNNWNGIDYLAISDYLKNRKIPNFETVEAVRKLTKSYVVPVHWEKIQINGSMQTVGRYSLCEEIADELDSYLARTNICMKLKSF